MLKRISLILVTAVLLSACGGKELTPTPEKPGAEQQEQPQEPEEPEQPQEPQEPQEPEEPEQPETPWTRTDVFDASDIVFSLGALSDIHISNGYGSEAKFTSALAQLRDMSAQSDPDGLDAIMFVGDLINTNSTSQAESFKNLYESVLNHDEIPMLYIPGNHDIGDPLKSVLDDSWFSTEVDPDMRAGYQARHYVVDSTHVIGMLPKQFSPMGYDPIATHWLDTTLTSITTKDPGKYVMVITHPMIYNTCYGSLLGPYWYTDNLTGVLEKYPQVIAFGGHLHFPLNDPRSIWQGSFTSMGCGSTSYMAIEDGKYEDMKSATVMKDAGEFSQGLLLQFDRSGNVRIHRMDFYHNTTIDKPWEISYPREDKGHLDSYSHTARRAANTPPVLSDIEFIQGVDSDSLRFAAGTDDEFVHHYVISIKKDGTLVGTKRILADFYRHPQTSGMKKTWTRPLGKLEEGSYEISVVAYDSWDAASNTISVTAGIRDPFTLWVSDAAGSGTADGGSGSVSEDWLSYQNGQLGWTQNTTGLPRVKSLTLPNGTPCKIIQVSEDDFGGEWTLYSKVFHRLGDYISTGNPSSAETKVSFGSPLHPEDGNNFGIRGLVGTATELVMDAKASIDYENGGARLGLFFDGRKGQKLVSGSHAGGYAAFLPELCGTKWANDCYEFGRTQIGSPNCDRLWLNVKIEDAKITATLIPLTAKVTVSHNYSEDNIIGIEVMHFSDEEVSDANLTRGSQTFTHVEGQTNSADYLVIHQANYKDAQSNGLYFVKN